MFPIRKLENVKISKLANVKDVKFYTSESTFSDSKE